MAPDPIFVLATSQSPGLPGTLAAAYNPGMCLLELPVIAPALYIEFLCQDRFRISPVPISIQAEQH